MGFFDENDELIDLYDPEGYGLKLNVQTRELGPDDELIGVYGRKDKEKWFTSLGFIVATKQTPRNSRASLGVIPTQKHLDSQGAAQTVQHHLSIGSAPSLAIAVQENEDEDTGADITERQSELIDVKISEQQIDTQ